MKYKLKEEPKTIDDFIAEDYLTVASLKRAVWQYMLDHAKPIPKGYLKIGGIIPNNEDIFWYRVKARETGKFKRSDEYVLKEKINELDSLFKRVLADKQSNEKRALYYQNIRQNGTLFQKTILWLSIFFKKIGIRLKAFL